MGASDSKPDAKAGYQWKSSGAPSVSMPVMDSLQSSPETDASRAKLIEQQIQARVSEELKKLSKRETDALAKAHESLASAAEKFKDDEGHTTYTVGKEVEALRKKLDERKTIRDMPENVETARSEVIRCLRENDRRPLDCWEEVERFKAEVKKLEKTWVDKVTA